jgi:hypothetical protein
MSITARHQRAPPVNFPIDGRHGALQLVVKNKKSRRVMMDRAGSFIVGAALVLFSALHIVSAPDYLNILPALILLYGIFRLVTNRSIAATLADEELSFAPPAEG